MRHSRSFASASIKRRPPKAAYAPPQAGEVKAKPLSPGLAAAGGFGFVDRAEPARALADLHLDLGVPAAGRLMVDAFAGTVDVALDGAVGRRCDRSGCRGQQDGRGIFRRLGGA